MSPPLSVLDLTPVPSGSTGRQALQNTVDLARAADGWGYTRYWLAEHHNLPGMASSAPEILIGRVADATARMRVGSGGIMLPNHSALQVAESFKVLEALHPGRIDLGIGRAPGTDGLTAMALRRSAQSPGENDFPDQLMELIAFGDDGLPGDHPFHSVRAEPRDVPLPPIWMLGSSDYGARVAAALGVGFAFARHMNPRGAEEAMGIYRDDFRPSPAMPEPYAILALSAVCADDRERAVELAMSLALGVVHMRSGRASTLPSPEEAAAHSYTPHEQDQVRRYLRAQVLGGPAEVAEQLLALAAATRADELMIMTSVHGHAERLRSYELIGGALL